MLEKSRRANKMDSCQIYSGYTYRYILSNSIRCLFVVSVEILTKNRDCITYLEDSFLFFFFFSFFVVVVVSYHQAPYFRDWFQIACSLTKPTWSFSASLTSINSGSWSLRSSIHLVCSITNCSSSFNEFLFPIMICYLNMQFLSLI